VETYNQEKTKYSLWKQRQLMCDVLRFQIQQEAVQEAYQHRFEAFKGVSVFPQNVHGDASTVTNLMPVRTDRLHPHVLPMLLLKLKKASFVLVDNFTSVTENLYYVQLNIGTCICRTATIHPTPQGLRWDRVQASGRVPINDVQIDECIVEILDENPVTPDKAFIGRGHLSIDKSLGYNMGREVEFSTQIFTREKNVLGTLKITLSVDVDEYSSKFIADPKNLNFFEINRKVSTMKKIEMGLDEHPLNTTSIEESVEVHAAESVMSENYCSLSALVSDLRGDGVDFIKLLTGDVTMNDLNRVGAEASIKFAQVSDFSVV